MKQEELQDQNITRGLISMIETNQRVLTKEVAEKITAKFNQKANQLNIKFNIDSNYLLRSPSEDAELYCLKKLETSNIKDIYHEVFKIANEYNLINVKANLYSKIADYYFQKKEYDSAFSNYNNSLSIYMNINENKMIPHLYWKIGLCKGMSLEHRDALTFFKLCETYSIIYKDRPSQQFILYDIALCYKKLEKFDIAIEYADKYLNFLTNKETSYFYANFLKANCYEALGLFDISIEIYNSLLSEVLDMDKSLILSIYNNLGLLYLDKNDFITSLDYFNKAEEIGNVSDKKDLCHTLIEKSELFIKQGLYNEAINTTLRGLEYAEVFKDYEYLLKGNYILTNIYESINDIQNLIRTYYEIANLLKNNKSFNELKSIYVKLAIIYLDKNDIKNAKQCLIMSQKYI